MKAHLTRFALTFAAAAILILAAAAPAAAATETFRDQYAFSVFVPCANGGLGEQVEGVLKLHVVIGETDDGAGGSHFHAQLKLQGAGLGTVTGDAYRLHADIPEIFANRINDNAGGSFNGAFSFSVDAIGMGDAANFHGTFRFQVTENANGVTTMEKGVFTETCN